MNLHASPIPITLQTPLSAIFSPKSWPFSLQWLPSFAYLVGGSVRDGLLGRQADHLDLDFVLPHDAVSTAKNIAKHYHAGFVLLDADRSIARVVFPEATADFAQQVGESLETDLQRRDFTVNAIAYHPHTETLLDPLQGCEDLKRGCLRMISPENLKDDPLRLLRAYRQAAQLDFSLDAHTQTTICQLSSLLAQVAPERVHAELSYLLSSESGTPMLFQAWQDGLLKPWLPHADQVGFSYICQIDQAASLLSHRYPDFGAALTGWVRDQQQAAGAGRSWLKTAKLSCLVAPDAETAEKELWHLKCSRAEVQSVLTLLRIRHQLQCMDWSTMTRRDQYFFFQSVGAVFPAVAVLAIAFHPGDTNIYQLVERFLTPQDPIAHPTPLVTGHELMTQLHLKPGRHIGQLLETLQIAHAEGKISTSGEALEFAQQQIQHQDLYR